MLINQLNNFKTELEQELIENILPFWLQNTLDKENGGFYGFISNEHVTDKIHDKASVLNSRILWTFSKAYIMYRDEKYLRMANIAFDYILKNFWDREFSGVYWMLDFKGRVQSSKKQAYAQAFAIYGLSEYYRATGCKESLTKAQELFQVMEKYFFDPVNKGYTEALSYDWKEIGDTSLSVKDMNVAKSMNTNLHVMEAYTNLLKIWDNESLKSSLKELINTTINYIIDQKSFSFKLFFSNAWESKSDITSYGHDIEGSWLLYEACEALGDELLLKKVRDISQRLAKSVLNKGLDSGRGGIFNESCDTEKPHVTKDWWPQAEAVVGFFNAYQLTGDERFLKTSFETWDFIKNNIIDKSKGEWFWDVSLDGRQHPCREKVGPWKCSYHNSRMCFEIIERINKITTNSRRTENE